MQFFIQIKCQACTKDVKPEGSSSDTYSDFEFSGGCQPLCAEKVKTREQMLSKRADKLSETGDPAAADKQL